MSLRNKLFGVAVAASMVSGAVIPAMAASITIQHAQAGETYKAYKIFDVVVNDTDTTDSVKTPDGYAYTIDHDSPFFNIINEKNDKYGLTLTGIEASKDASGNFTKYVVEKTDAFIPADFADALLEKINDHTTPIEPSFTETVIEGATSVTISVNDTNNEPVLGYYLVDTANPALAGLITVYDDITIADKGNGVKLVKAVDDPLLAVDDVATFTLTSTVPYIRSQDTDFELTFVDTLPEGLTLLYDQNNPVTVQVNGATPTVDATITAQDETKDILTIVLDLDDDSGNPYYEVGQSVTVTYKAKLNSNATFSTDTENDGNTNSATLSYPGSETQSGLTATATVYSTSLNVNKTDRDQPNVTLPDATFILSRTNSDGSTEYYKSTPNETDPTVKPTISWTTKRADATPFVTNRSGNFTTPINGLDPEDTSYKLIETEAPAGYNILTEPKEVTFTGATASNPTTLITNYVPVENGKGMQLPETGGMGTTLFYIAGGTLVAGAAVLLITKKRMSEAE